MTTAAASPVIYCHTDHPEWGRGVVLPAPPGRDDRYDLSFEAGGRRVLMKTFAGKLRVAHVTPTEANALVQKLAPARRPAPAGGTRTKRPAVKDAVVMPDFEGQLHVFRKLFPEGFKDPRVERANGVKSSKRDQSPLALAAKAFAADKLQDTEAVLAAAETLVRTAGLVHPLDGLATITAITDGQRAVFVAGLREWLYGSAPEADRFDAFVEAIQEAAGTALKRPSWPFVTLFAALVHPTRHVCVRTTAFQKQAALMNLPLRYTPTPGAAAYEQFLTISRATETALGEAGEEPRNLLDVSAFIVLTHAAKVKKPVAVK